MRPVAVWMMGYLLNAAWQTPLIFATAWVVARVARRAGPSFEHRVWTSALLLEAILPACTVRPSELLREASRWLAASGSREAAQGAHVTVTMAAGQTRGGVAIADAWLAALVCAYAGSLLYFAARLGAGLYRTARLRRHAHVLALDGEAGSRFRRYARLFAVEDAIAATSAEICGPVTLGIRRRMLLLPVDFHTSLPGEDLDAALAHEFAHMRRHDFAKNLVLELAALPIAFHPLLWLTRSRVAESRELVCDAMAAEAVQGREKYARSLLRLASHVSETGSSLATHAIGIFDANNFGNFERRIMNLTGKRNELRGVRRLAMVALSVVFGLGACTSALALRVQIAAPAPSPEPATSPSPAPSPSPQAASQQPAPMVMAVPRPATGTPAASFTMETVPQASADATPAHMQVTSPTVVEDGRTADDAPLQVSASAMAGNIATKVQPVYPQAAKDAKIQGAVVLHAIIGKDGQFKSLQLVSGPEELQASAWDAVKQWTYKPFLLNGEPVEVETTITVNYSLAE